MARPRTPAEAWKALSEGNHRFTDEHSEHPNQSLERRESLAHEQLPYAALFGCSDSRLSAEIIFDVGLGDLFVVRNAGQVLAESILGSLEYAVEVLGVPLIVVLGHDECGAISAAIDSSEGRMKARGQYIQHIVAAIHPRVSEARTATELTADIVSDLNVRQTVLEITKRSRVIAEAIDSGKLAVVGANYRLVAGEVNPILVVGEV